MSQAMLQEKYLSEIAPELMKEFSLESKMSVPKLEKIVVNTCVKNAVTDKKLVESAVKDMAVLTGQQPVVTRAKKAISNFKLREGMPLGCRVTLRGRRMYDFLLRLSGMALPRSRDFKGISRKGFDGKGNYTLGLAEQVIFPEVDQNSQNIFGMNITFVTTAKNDDQGRRLLELMGLPFRKN